MKRLLAASLVGAAAMIGGTAHAQDSKGVYIELDAGIAQTSDTDLTYYDVGGTFGGAGTTDTAESEVSLDSAFTFGGALGYDFGIVRAEVAVDYVKNGVESLTVTSVNGSSVTLDPDEAEEVCDYLEIPGCQFDGNTFTADDAGHVRQLSAMANAWLDIPLGGTITPYVGGGVGIGGFETDGEGDAKFAWQVGAGVALNLSPSISLTANYRHREISGSVIEWNAASGFEVGDLKTDAFTAGVRFTL